MSCTVTKNDFVALLPWASVAVQLTCVVPTVKVAPDAGVHVTGTVPSTVSVAAGFVKVTTAPPGPVASVVMSAGGAPTVGAVVSCTVTLNDLFAVLVW